MVTMKRSAFIWSLLLCLILVNGLMAAPSVTHAAHHGHHQAGTHSTGLCAWLCTAGQAIETLSVSFEPTFRLVDQIVVCGSIQSEQQFCSLIFLRGPPTHSL
jgi:hypothetical protein